MREQNTIDRYTRARDALEKRGATFFREIDDAGSVAIYTFPNGRRVLLDVDGTCYAELTSTGRNLTALLDAMAKVAKVPK